MHKNITFNETFVKNLLLMKAFKNNADFVDVYVDSDYFTTKKIKSL